MQLPQEQRAFLPSVVCQTESDRGSVLSCLLFSHLNFSNARCYPLFGQCHCGSLGLVFCVLDNPLSISCPTSWWGSTDGEKGKIPHIGLVQAPCSKMPFIFGICCWIAGRRDRGTAHGGVTESQNGLVGRSLKYHLAWNAVAVLSSSMAFLIWAIYAKIHLWIETKLIRQMQNFLFPCLFL